MLDRRNRLMSVYFHVGDRLCSMPADRVLHLDTIPPFIRCSVLPKIVLGVTNVGGRIMPLIDLRIIFDEKNDHSSIGGELVVVALIAGPLALKVDRILRVSAWRQDDGAGNSTDLTERLDRLLAEISLARGTAQSILTARPEAESRPIANSAVPAELTPPRSKKPCVAVESSKGVIYMSYDCIDMVSDTLEIAMIPDPNPTILGMTFHRSVAIPVLCLDGLLGDLPSPTQSRAFVIMTFRQQTVAIAVRRIIQLAFDQDEPSNLEDLLRQFLTGCGERRSPPPSASAPEASKRYLLIDIAGQCCGFALEEVDRIETDNVVVPVPWGTRRIQGLTNIAGDVLPVLDVGLMLGLKSNCISPAVYIVLKDSRSGRVAVPIDRLRRIVAIPAAALLEIGAGTQLDAITHYDGNTVWVLSISSFTGPRGSEMGC